MAQTVFEKNVPLGGPPRGWSRAPWVHTAAVLTMLGPLPTVVLFLLSLPSGDVGDDGVQHMAAATMTIGAFYAGAVISAVTAVAATVAGALSLVRREPRRPLAAIIVAVNGLLLVVAGWLLSGRTL